jgi:xylose dehydrogenase (NAD/NADP)
MNSLRFGILGAARIAERRVIPAIRKSANAMVTGIASRDAARAQACADRLGIPKAYGSYETLLDDPGVDAVYIPLPNALHCEWTIKAAEKGKHVLCEKPFAANAGEVDEMIAACEAHRVLLMEAFMYRFHPQNEKALELIRHGEIGAVKLVRAAFCFTIAEETNIRLSQALAGGSLMDVGTYCVSAARTLSGAEPEAALALAHVGALSGVDETMAGLLRFPAGAQNQAARAAVHSPEGVVPAGALASFECSFRMPYRTAYEVIGERGRIEVPAPFITNNKETAIVLHYPDDRTRTFSFPAVDQYTLMIEHFAGCVLEQQPLRYPAAEGRAQMQALDALRKSAQSGKTEIIGRKSMLL